MEEVFLQLVRLGLGVSQESSLYIDINWTELQAIADKQGLSAIIVDGIEQLKEGLRPEKMLLLQWIGEAIQDEDAFAAQKKEATRMAALFHTNFIRTYVLKGFVVAECYPRPNHRVSADFDCYLLPAEGEFDAWTLGNDLIKSKGFGVETVFYKNSTFFLPELKVENHRFLTPFRGNRSLKNLELLLQRMIRDDKGEDRFEGTCLYRPPVMVSAIFLVEHAYSHFLHEGLTWRLVLDWKMFSRKHESEIDWNALGSLIDEFGFRKFYDSYDRLGQYLLGEIQEDELSGADRKMLADVWAPLDLHKSARGWRGKLALAGNTWRARWKYRLFGDISMIQALWIQIKGYLFIKNPVLS